MRACAVCFSQDVRHGSEGGGTNAMVFCDACGIPVHIFCYGQTHHGDAFDRGKGVASHDFVCDHCHHLAGGGAPQSCFMCPRPGGLLRPLQQGGRWVHPACMLYNPNVTLTISEKHVDNRLCGRQSGCQTCLRLGLRLTSPWKPGGTKGVCTSATCPDPTFNAAALIQCGGQGAGCRRQVHVSCGQRVRSGWHIKLLETEDASVVEVLCSACDHCFLDVAGPQPTYKHTSRQCSGSSERFTALRYA